MYENPHEQKIAEAMGYADRGKPHVSFFDHAVPDSERTEQLGRPCFKAAVYIQKIPSAPDLVTRDRFTRKATEDDKREFPEEWRAYVDRKTAQDTLDPPIIGIPGMDVAAKAEMLALNIRTCRQLVAFPKPLEGLEHLRETARQVLEVADGSRREIHEGREAVRTEADRQPHHPASVSWGSPQAEEETFNYSFQV